jgi:hypothetical protein
VRVSSFVRLILLRHLGARIPTGASWAGLGRRYATSYATAETLRLPVRRHQPVQTSSTKILIPNRCANLSTFNPAGTLDTGDFSFPDLDYARGQLCRTRFSPPRKPASNSGSVQEHWRNFVTPVLALASSSSLRERCGIDSPILTTGFRPRRVPAPETQASRVDTFAFGSAVLALIRNARRSLSDLLARLDKLRSSVDEAAVAK